MPVHYDENMGNGMVWLILLKWYISCSWVSVLTPFSKLVHQVRSEVMWGRGRQNVGCSQWEEEVEY